MSKPILPISHLDFCFSGFSLTRPVSPICQSPFFPYLTVEFFFSAPFPEAVPSEARELIVGMLCREPEARLGGDAKGGLAALTNTKTKQYETEYKYTDPLKVFYCVLFFKGGLAALRAHGFFEGIVWDSLHTRPPPPLAGGATRPAPNAKWSRRQNSMMWSPLPSRYTFEGVMEALSPVKETAFEADAPFVRKLGHVSEHTIREVD